MGKRIRKWKRRKGGIYAWRTRKHTNPFRREWGYVGETNSFARRQRDHKGQTAYRCADGSMQQSTGKPWMDLDPTVYRVIRVPWWLCWKWVLRPLETFVILLLWPRYNQAKNRWNPRRVSIRDQQNQRAARNGAGRAYQARVVGAVWGRRVAQVLGVACILAAVIGAAVTR